MRLAEEEKLRKEMSAKKAKEEAERKHQVSWGCADSLDIHSPVQQPSANTGCPASVHATFLPSCAGCLFWARPGQRAVAPERAGPGPQLCCNRKNSLSRGGSPQPCVATEHLKGQSIVSAKCTLGFFFFSFWPRSEACGILVPRPGIEPGPIALKAPSPNHWTAREFPITY